MIHFTSYAEQKFEILNRHKVYITKEQVMDAILSPDRLEIKGQHVFAAKDGACAVYRLDDEAKYIITFYPVK